MATAKSAGKQAPAPSAKKTASAAKAAPAKAAPAKPAPAKATNAKAASAKPAPVKASSVTAASAKAASPKAASAKAAAPKSAPAKATSTKATSTKAAPAKAAPAKAASAKAAPAKVPAVSTKAAAPAPVKKPATAAKKVAAPAPAPVRKPSRPGVSVVASKDFDEKFLEGQRVSLLAEREQLTGQAVRLEAEANSLIEDVEMGDVQFDDESGEGDTMVVERERDLALSAQARQIVTEIDLALERLANGTYGYSVQSNLPIPRERLKAIPWATLRVDEKAGGIGRR